MPTSLSHPTQVLTNGGKSMLNHSPSPLRRLLSEGASSYDETGRLSPGEQHKTPIMSLYQQPGNNQQYEMQEHQPSYNQAPPSYTPQAAAETAKPEENNPHTYTQSYKYVTGCCGSRKIHSVKMKPKLGVLNVKKKVGFCCCCMSQVNGSARLKDLKSVELETPNKSLVLALILWFLGGLVGAHRFYTGRWKTGILWAMTFGLGGIGWLLDVCFIPGWIGAAQLHFNVAGPKKTAVFGDICVEPLSAKRLRNDVQYVQSMV